LIFKSSISKCKSFKYRLYLLYKETKITRYLNQAYQNAKVLAANIRPSNATHAPWAFRVNYITGQTFSNKSGNMAMILTLFDLLIEQENKNEFIPVRDQTLKWVLNYQIPSIFASNQPGDNLFVGFFEDKFDPEEVDRDSWCALELARYLILRRKNSTDPNWLEHVQQLLGWALENYGGTRMGNVTIMGEQDNDKKPFGGANTKLAGVTGLLSCAGGPSYYKIMSQNNLYWHTYFIDTDGCPADLDDGVCASSDRGGWQEDAHTDVIHNYVDALNSFKGIC